MVKVIFIYKPYLVNRDYSLTLVNLQFFAQKWQN